MQQLKKIQISLLLIILSFVTALLCVITFAKTIYVNAQESETLEIKLEEYTKSDIFTYEVDGNTYTGNINQYIDNHKDQNNKINGKYIDDPIIHIIPKELFITENETNYFGNEYGFYIKTYNAKAGDKSLKSDVLLFDINEFNSMSKREITTRVSLVFQLSFFTVFKSDYETEYWNNSYSSEFESIVRCTNLINAFNIRNIKFGYMVLNEHSLNQGDFQYDKYKDNGATIMQTRFNFKGITNVNTTEEEKTETLVEIGYGAVENYIPYAKEIKNVISLIDDASGLISHKPVEVEYNNEANIYTHKDRAEQLSTQDQLTKVSYIKPCYSTYLVSPSHYAEGVCVLDNLSEDARLFKSIAFDIYSGVDKVAEFNATKFDTCSATVPALKTLSINDNGIYLLPKGEQLFQFNPIYGSEYSFNTDKNLDVEVWSGNDYLGNSRVILEADKNYDIKIKANKDAYGAYVLNVIPKFLTINVDSQISVTQGEYILGIDIFDKGIYEIQSDNLNIKAVLNNNFQSIENINTDTKAKQFLGDVDSKYYFILYNSSSGNLLSKICCSSNMYSLGSSNSINVNSNKKYFSYQTNDAGYYSFTLSPQVYLQLYDSTLYDISNSAFILSSSFSTTYTLNLQSNQNVIVSLLNNSGDAKVELEINKIESAFKWVINGEEVKDNVTYVERGGHLSNVQLKIHNELIDPVVILSNNYLYKSGRDIIAPIDTRLEETVLFLADDYNCFPLTIKIIPEWKITVLSINDTDNSFFQIATTRTDTTTNNSDSLKIYYSLDFYPKDRNTQQYNISLGFNKSQNVQCFNLSDSYVGTAKLTLNKVVLNENSENPKVIFNSASPTNDPYKTNISAKYIHSKYGNDPNPTANNYGESNNPFIISNVRHFQNIKYSPSAHFNQIDNIDFNYSYTATRQGFAFSGVYNGQNFELKNVSLSYWTTNALISGEIYKCWGGLFSVNKGVIENVNITVYSYVDSAVDYGTPGVVSTINYVGGIVGKNYGTIRNCETHGTIQSYSYNSKSGGVVGYNSEGDILSCKNYTEMTSYGDVGGIVGYDYKGYIYNSENRARVYLDLYNEINRSAGGIVGEGVNSCISEVKNFNIIYWKGTYSTSRTLAPRMGGFAGTLTSGYFHGTNYSYVYEGKLHTEVWKSGSKNYTWCQYQYAEENGLVGRQL